MALINKLTAIADSIREKTGKTDVLTLDQMPLEIAGIQTGVELNFKVVGGTTKPASASENTIWINTNVKISEWTFSATEPEAPSAGMVWIITDTKSTTSFNALKKNNINLYPVAAKQYVNGAWVSKTIKSNQGDEWTESAIPRTYIFKSGEGALVATKSRSGRQSSVTLTQDSIAFYCGTGDTGTVIQTQNPISLTSFSKLKARAVCTSATSTSHPAQIGFATALAGDYTVKPDISHVVITADSVEREYSLPIPSGVESAYIGIYGMFNGNVYDLWLE